MVKDALNHTVAADQAAAEIMAEFLKTAEGQELQQKLERGVLDEVGYDQAVAQALAEFLKKKTPAK